MQGIHKVHGRSIRSPYAPGGAWACDPTPITSQFSSFDYAALGFACSVIIVGLVLRDSCRLVVNLVVARMTAVEDKLEQAEEAPLQRFPASMQVFLQRSLQCCTYRMYE